MDDTLELQLNIDQQEKTTEIERATIEFVDERSVNNVSGVILPNGYVRINKVVNLSTTNSIHEGRMYPPSQIKYIEEQ